MIPAAASTHEALTGDDGELRELELPEWLTVHDDEDDDDELVSPGLLVGVVYLDGGGELHSHDFKPDQAPVLLVGKGALLAAGPDITLTDLGIED